MKTTIMTLSIVMTLAPTAWAQKSVSSNRTKNDNTGKVELCTHGYPYSNSTEQERACLVGRDDLLTCDFIVKHSAKNSVHLRPYYCGGDASNLCRKFGYRSAHLMISKPIVTEILGDQTDGELGRYVKDCDLNSGHRPESAINAFKCAK